MRSVRHHNFKAMEITLVKDILSIVVTVIVTTIGVFTFIRAKKTFLMPIRSEIIKKQSLILSDFIELVRNKNHFLVQLEYRKVLNYNAIYYLDKFQLQINTDKEKHKYKYTLVITEFSRDLKVIHTFESKEKSINIANNEISVIYLSDSQYQFYEKIRDFTTNPFLPISIQQHIKSILSDIEFNYTHATRLSLLSFINDFKIKSKNDANFILKVDGIYPDYFIKRESKKHDKDLDNLFNEIRKYMLIDEKW